MRMTSTIFSPKQKHKSPVGGEKAGPKVEPSLLSRKMGKGQITKRGLRWWLTPCKKMPREQELSAANNTNHQIQATTNHQHTHKPNKPPSWHAVLLGLAHIYRLCRCIHNIVHPTPNNPLSPHEQGLIVPHEQGLIDVGVLVLLSPSILT